MNSSRSLLILKGIKWLMQSGYEGPLPDEGQRLLAEINAEIEQAESVTAAIRAARAKEKPPIVMGKKKEKENGEGNGDRS